MSSSSSWEMIRMDISLRSTSAREVTISATYNPPPYSRHSRRNAVLVMPAIGARTTGVSTVCRPSCRGGSASLGGVGVLGEITVTVPFSQIRPNRPNAAGQRWNGVGLAMRGAGGCARDGLAGVGDDDGGRHHGRLAGGHEF